MGLLQTIPADWKDLGLGTARDMIVDTVTQASISNRVFYKVIEWPACQALRHSFMLPQRDLHITVGFEHSDLHHVRKDAKTLLHNNPDSHAHHEWWPVDSGLPSDQLQQRICELNNEMLMRDLARQQAILEQMRLSGDAHNAPTI